MARTQPVASEIAQIRLLFAVTLCLVVRASAENLNLVILHNNDMHGRFEETSRASGTCKHLTPRTGGVKSRDSCVGGFARTAHEIRKFRKLAEQGASPVLYLNAGDTYVGTPWFSVHKWRICAEFVNRLRPDAMSLGNHEFDFGVAALAPFVDAVKFPILAANLDFQKEPTLNRVNKSVVLTVSGRKVGIIGHLTTDTIVMASPGYVIFHDVVESVRKEAEILDKAGVKIIIVLGHSGYDLDRKIAAEVPLVDVVIGGHTNTFLWNGPQPDSEKPEDMYPKVITQPSGKRVPVVQAYAYTKYLGALNVTFDASGDLVHFAGQPIFLDTDVPQDPDILDLLETYRPEVLLLEKAVVGRSSVLLEANKCRLQECNFGNMIADAFVFYMAAQHVGPGWTDTPIGLINGGTIRTTVDPSIHGGNITKGEIMGTLPFESQVVSVTLNGSDLLKTLEIGVRSNGETSRGEFLQVSGLRVVYDLAKPSHSRVVSVKVRCGNCTVPIYEPLQPDKLYRLVTLSFLTGGGDYHVYLRDGAEKKVQDLVDVDTVAWYLGKQSPVYPEVQGRIEFVKSASKPSKGSRAAFGSVTLLVILLSHVLYNLFVPCT